MINRLDPIKPVSMIDLRSDTVTRPSPGMRQAMASAEVGDDVYGEDPTVNRLEKHAAGLLGKEGAIFVPTGTMGNQIAIRLHCRSGDELITETHSHIFLYESAGAASLSGVQIQCLQGRNGILDAKQISAGIRESDDHCPNTTLICLENTHNRGGGTLYSISEIQKIRELAKARKIFMHLDGARLFNAVAASGTPAAQYAANFDTVSFCLSKGLGAPAGSLVCSDRESIKKLRRIRKMFGGGMRQAGILAAAGMYALENNGSRLKEDHSHARLIAESLSKIPGVKLDLNTVQTNIVIFDIADTGISVQKAIESLKDQGILMCAVGSTAIRVVTHLDVNEKQIREACKALEKILA